jgi:hypothetical protein
MSLVLTNHVVTRSAALTALALGLAIGGPAYAIDCQQGFQRVQGNLIATPYCQDEYLAIVARQFGVKASADRIRNNPSYKREVCAIAGRDIRVQTACLYDNAPGRGGRF